MHNEAATTSERTSLEGGEPDDGEHGQTDSRSFSERLKAATDSVHQAAERSTFMERLVDGRSSIAEYATLLRQYHVIYGALEDAGSTMRDDPVGGGFAVAELERLDAIEADLTALAGDDWADRLAVVDATETNAARIREVCHDWPGGFVAHHYVRYLGDLSGGQILRRILGRVFSIGDGAGLDFYVFDRIDNGVQFKKLYRTRLDRAPWDDDEQERICREAVLAFRLNTDVFAALDTARDTGQTDDAGRDPGCLAS